MTKRRHAADDETGALAHKVGVGLADRLAEQRSQPGLIHPVQAAGFHQHGAVALQGAEDQRFDDLPNRAAHCLGSLLRGAGRSRQLDHFQRQAEGLQGGLHFLGAGAESHFPTSICAGASRDTFQWVCQ